MNPESEVGHNAKYAIKSRKKSTNIRDTLEMSIIKWWQYKVLIGAPHPITMYLACLPYFKRPNGPLELCAHQMKF